MKDRNSYLINKSLGRFLFASIATMAIVNINNVVDSILMGQLIGPQAVSAIQNVSPVTGLLAGISLLLTAGASIIIAKALGRRDFDEASSSLTTAIVSCFGFGVLISLLSLTFSSGLTSALCLDPALYDNTYKYLSVMLGGAFLLIVMNGTGGLVEVVGYPKLVSVSMLTSVVVNLICDILYVKVFSMDIGGAALATLTGYLVASFMFLFFLFRKRRSLGIRPYFKGFGHMLGENMKMGVPSMLSSLALTLMIFMCNFFVQSVHGETGLFVMSIGLTLVILGQMVSGGVESAFLGIGGMLVGQRDYDGLRRLLRRGLTISIGFAVLCNVAVWFIAEHLATLFGAKDPAVIEMTGQGLPLIAMTNFALSVILPMVIIFQLNEHPVLSMISALSLLINLGIGFILAKYVIKNIWVAFPIGSALSILLIPLISIPVRKKAGNSVGRIHLIPVRLEGVERLDLSVPCDRNRTEGVISSVREFLEGKCSEERIMGVAHCIDELLLNYTQHSGKSEKAYMDISLILDAEGLSLFVKDDGVPFDPVHVEADRERSGLTIVKEFMNDADYSYSFGQNIVTMKWRKEV